MNEQAQAPASTGPHLPPVEGIVGRDSQGRTGMGPSLAAQTPFGSTRDDATPTNVPLLEQRGVVTPHATMDRAPAATRQPAMEQRMWGQ